MPLNPSAMPFKPISSAPIAIALPEDPWGADVPDVALSPEEALELEEVQSWVEMMADFEESESDHLISLAMRHADKNRIQALRAAAPGAKGHAHRRKH